MEGAVQGVASGEAPLDEAEDEQRRQDEQNRGDEGRAGLAQEHVGCQRHQAAGSLRWWQAAQ